MTKLTCSFLLLLVLTVFSACEEEANPLFDQESFTRIYDNRQFSAAFSPIDLKQTSDGGYLILSNRKLPESHFSGIYIMKVDKNGEFVKEIEVDAAYVNAIGQLMELNGEYYFFCMEEFSLQAQLAKVDANAEAVEMTAVSGGDHLLSYPAAAAQDGINFILHNYDHEEKQSVLSIVNATGGVAASMGVTIGVGDEVEEPIINHFFQTGRKFPFQAGRIPGGLYYFNGFHNYTFSLVFTNFGSDDPVGVVQGQQDDGGFSAVEPLAATKFAAARFNFGDNYLLPNVVLTTSGVSSSTDLGGNTLPELTSNARVKIIRSVIQQKNILIYGSDTKSKQIGLLFYDEATGEFFGTHYLGFSNPFELASMVQTDDGGLAVCGTTYVAGRFPRACLFKLSKDELAQNIN